MDLLLLGSYHFRLCVGFDSSVFHILKMSTFLFTVISSQFPFVLWLYNIFVPCLSFDWSFKRKEAYVFKYFVNKKDLNVPEEYFIFPFYGFTNMLKVHEKQQGSNSFSSVWITDNVVKFQDLRRHRLEITGMCHYHK